MPSRTLDKYDISTRIVPVQEAFSLFTRRSLPPIIHGFRLSREESEHVLDSFPVVRRYEERDYGEYRTRRLILEAYNRMASAVANGGKGWRPLADIPAGFGPRHE